MHTVDKKFNYLAPLKVKNLQRVGGSNDGGYIIAAEPFNDSDILISFGIGESFNLEECYANKKIVHAYDHTIDLKKFFIQFLKYLKRFLILKSSFGSVKSRYNNLIKYYLLKKKKFFHFKKKLNNQKISKNDILINEVFNKTLSKNIFFSIDIEGDEYKILDQIITEHHRINLILIEFHDLDTNQILFDKIVKKLQQFFTIIHLHGNNNSFITNFGLPDVLEMTLINKNNCPFTFIIYHFKHIV